ncbi:helix-turn-helix transcriptional regulator [Peterkaempfera bronchialis]|uniref:AraC family transcriptional regulator n=1 Tax=Peterkaempfera bronchialis TaxID=2126346 RepID=A0A345T297_9ACTN|nr:AraC family transcriptional regulator [Peterkaempfera bronchialis]AXI80102.1 AraC family transcriptional regulator [Peterkaempfera bronchialis]
MLAYVVIRVDAGSVGAVRGLLVRSEIERVVFRIREAYGENLTLADLSQMARLSPCYMARLFHQETGLPPAAFLMAVRMEEARRLLLHTQASVADISVGVGYTSIGAFTTRFTKTIGVSPGRYRRLASLGSEAVNFVYGGNDVSYAYGSIQGRTRRFDGMTDETVFVAAFPATASGAAIVSRSRSARCRRVERVGESWRIAHVPEGRWFVQAVSRSDGAGGRCMVVGTAGPLLVTPGATVRVDLLLGPAAGQRYIDEARVLVGAALPDLFRD